MLQLRVALVGGGPVAAAVLENLLGRVAQTKSAAGAEVTVFEPAQRLWTGYAYQPDCDEVLVNAPLPIMALRLQDREHALRWMAANYDPGFDPARFDWESFPPRHVFGRYLTEVLTETVEAFKQKGGKFNLVPYAVCRVRREAGHIYLDTLADRHGPYGAVVLAPGSSLRSDPYGLGTHSGFIQDPYPLLERIAAIPPQARVGILGCGLTAVDVMLALVAQGHEGPIHLVSRRGLLPAPRRRRVAAEPMYLTAEQTIDRLDGRPVTLAMISGWASKELQALGVDPSAAQRELQPHDTGMARLHRQFAQRDSPSVWQGVLLKGAQRLSADLWYLMDDPARRVFMARYHHHFMSLVNAMPPATARTLIHLEEQGRISVHPRLATVVPGAGGLQLELTHATLTVDTLINAITHVTPAPHPLAEPLINALLADNLATPHPYGGLQVERTTCRLLHPDGIADPSLFLLGELIRGAFYWTSGLPVLAPLADRISRTIMNRAT